MGSRCECAAAHRPAVASTSIKTLVQHCMHSLPALSLYSSHCRSHSCGSQMRGGRRKREGEKRQRACKGKLAGWQTDGLQICSHASSGRITVGRRKPPTAANEGWLATAVAFHTAHSLTFACCLLQAKLQVCEVHFGQTECTGTNDNRFNRRRFSAGGELLSFKQAEGIDGERW